MPPPDPTDEQRTSAVFQPFPPDLVKRLSPREESPPPLSPIPSESDLSDRRYSDVSIPSVPDDVHPESERLHFWDMKSRDLTPIPCDEKTGMERNTETECNTETERLRLWDMTTRDDTPAPPPPLFRRDRTPSVPPSPQSRKPQGISIRVPSPRIGLQERRTAADVFAEVPLHSPSLSTLRRREEVHVVKEHGGQARRGPWWRWWRGRGRKEKKDMEPLSKETKEWWGESFRALRLRGERDQSSSGLFVSVPVREGSARGSGRKRSGRCSSASLERGGSLGSLQHLQREKFTVADGQREAYSFAGYRGKWAMEGSSVSSSEDREEDRAYAESHLYLSRRQLRAMQYR